MKVKKIELRNFRSFKELDLEFNEQVNVIIGNNGYGKSTILDALAILLSMFVNKLEPKNKRAIKESDIKKGYSITKNTIYTEINGKDLDWNSSRKKSFKDGRKKSKRQAKLTKEVDLILESLDENNKNSVPLIAYYAVNRAVIDVPLRIKTKHKFNQLSTYDKSLISGTDFRSFFEWFREEEDWENEQRSYPVEDVNEKQMSFFEEHKEPSLNAVRQAIFKLTGFSNIRIRRKPSLQMQVKKGETYFDINQLSDGEKCLLAMVGDLARRLAIANPSFENPLSGEGVILIDEIDLHLHPKWQRVVMPKLTEVFPNCQFIVSTHSPQVLGEVQPENIIVLNENGGYISPTDSYGWNSDYILEDMMGTTPRTEKSKNDLDTLFLLLKDEKLEDAKKKYLEIENQYGKLPELSKANVIMSYLESK